MQSIRRSVFRAVTSPLVKPRSITTTSNQFLARVNRPAATIQSLNFRRWNSDSAIKSQEEHQVDQEIKQSEEATSGNSFTNSISNAAHSVAETASDAFGSYAEKERSPRADIPEASSVYIGNLSFEVTSEDLQKEFAQFGEVKSARVATDARGLSKGFGYVEFEGVETAKAAIEAKDQTIFEGRRMIVNFQNKSATTRAPTEPTRTLFIGNLAFEMSDADLNKLFREVRNVVDVRVAIDRRTGQPRGFAHADFVDIASAEKGLEFLQGKEVYGRALRVDYSGSVREKTNNGPRRDASGRGGDRY